MKFVAFERAKQGTGASRRLRNSGKTPGIVYGGEGAPLLIELDHNALWHALKKEAFHASVLEMDMDGKTSKVLLRDVQYHPFKQMVQHIDGGRVKFRFAVGLCRQQAGEKRVAQVFQQQEAFRDVLSKDVGRGKAQAAQVLRHGDEGLHVIRAAGRAVHQHRRPPAKLQPFIAPVRRVTGQMASRGSAPARLCQQPVGRFCPVNHPAAPFADVAAQR